METLLVGGTTYILCCVVRLLSEFVRCICELSCDLGCLGIILLVLIYSLSLSPVCFCEPGPFLAL